MFLCIQVAVAASVVELSSSLVVAAPARGGGRLQVTVAMFLRIQVTMAASVVGLSSSPV